MSDSGFSSDLLLLTESKLEVVFFIGGDSSLEDEGNTNSSNGLSDLDSSIEEAFLLPTDSSLTIDSSLEEAFLLPTDSSLEDDLLLIKDSSLEVVFFLPPSKDSSSTSSSIPSSSSKNKLKAPFDLLISTFVVLL